MVASLARGRCSRHSVSWNATGVSQFLARHGRRCATAKDGVEMRSQITVGRFDLVVLDLMLPGEDGLSLCRWLRHDSQVPVIMLTAIARTLLGMEGGDVLLANRAGGGLSATVQLPLTAPSPNAVAGGPV